MAPITQSTSSDRDEGDRRLLHPGEFDIISSRSSEAWRFSADHNLFPALVFQRQQTQIP
jgi:hypothetical protein